MKFISLFTIMAAVVSAAPKGSNPCTRGPSYWCASLQNAHKCSFNPINCEKYCDNEDNYPSIQNGNVCKPPSGKQKCTQGPSYWCASQNNAKQCGFDVEDCQTYCDDADEYPEIQNGNVCVSNGLLQTSWGN